MSTKATAGDDATQPGAVAVDRGVRPVAWATDSAIGRLRTGTDAVGGALARTEDQFFSVPLYDRAALEAAYAAGWRTAASWMGRDDLHADVGSPAYEADRRKALEA